MKVRVLRVLSEDPWHSEVVREISVPEDIREAIVELKKLLDKALIDAEELYYSAAEPGKYTEDHYKRLVQRLHLITLKINDLLNELDTVLPAR